jgi:hypothetical protein
MVSFQQSLFPWFEYEMEYPSIDQYVPTYIDRPITIDQPNKPDQKVIQWLRNNIQNFFVESYIHYKKAFSDKYRYTLFIPINVKKLFFTTGNSFVQREEQTKYKIDVEQLLTSHMVRYYISPKTIQGQDVMIETLSGTKLSIRNDGMVDNQPDNYIIGYITFPNAILYIMNKPRK